MDSMYERLMGLPLFKGASTELIHSFAEKTPLRFTTYKPGETIVRERDNCSTVKCVVSGSVVCEHHLFNGAMTVREFLDAGVVLAVEHLFGLDTRYGICVKANSQCGIMEFSKKQYMQLLQTHNLVLLNYLNYLARRAQNCEHALSSHTMKNISSELSFLVQVSSNVDGHDIDIETSGTPIIEVLSGGERAEDRDFEELIKNGFIEILSDYKIKIPSRKLLLDYFSNEE